MAEKFEEVVGASQTREAKILQAQAHAISTNNWATGESFKRIVDRPKPTNMATITNAAARALLFTNQELAYSAAPGFKASMNSTPGWTRWSITAPTPANTSSPPPTSRTFPFYNLEDKIREDLGIIENLSAPSNK